MQLDVFCANDVITVCLICVRIKAVTGMSGDSVFGGHLHLLPLRLHFSSFHCFLAAQNSVPLPSAVASPSSAYLSA